MNQNGYYSYSNYLQIVMNLKKEFPMAIASAGKIGDSLQGNDIMRIDVALPGRKELIF